MLKSAIIFHKFLWYTQRYKPKGVEMFKTLLAALIACTAILFPANISAAPIAAAPHNHKNVKKSSPFLITSGLPHYTMILKKRWDDPKLALTPDQKKRLLKIRKATLASVMPLKREVMKLQKKIVKAAMKGAKPESLSNDVEKVAKLKAEATKTHLKCIYDTRKVLTPKQLKYLHGTILKKRGNS